MRFFKYFFLFFIISLASGSHLRHRKNAKANLNYRPIIGALTQEVTGKLIDFYGNHVSYLAASYVKHLESAGARVVPIWIGKDKAYYRGILSLINGAFLPGGASEFNVTEGYAEAGNYIMEIAEEFNSKGDYFPVWGTCLGFELLGYIANGNKEIREDCSSHNEAIPLIFKPDFAKSKLFKDMPTDLVQILSKENSTMNFHQYCLTEKGFQKAGLLKTWSVLSTNIDEHGMEYISTMEHKTRPYWGVQFHPEKPAYEWNPQHNTPHTATAIRANQYFADFFVSQDQVKLSAGFKGVGMSHPSPRYAFVYKKYCGPSYKQPRCSVARYSPVSEDWSFACVIQGSSPGVEWNEKNRKGR